MGRRTAVDAVLCCVVFLTTFFFRFNSLGGSFGGFSNDEFGYLARARQIQAGEVPFRDFNDPGWFLTDYVAATAQWLAGYNLRSEALLTIGMLSAAAALTFWLSRRAAGSVVAALFAVAIHIALSPRHYNYPKLLLYAAGIAAAWAYVDKPGRVRLAGIGAVIGIAFLFRHDHLFYLGALGVMTVAMVHGSSIRNAVPDAAFLCSIAAVFVVPFLVFLALAGGVGEYFRLALVYAERDAQRTTFSLPRFSPDPSKPLLALHGGVGDDGVEVHVRWRPVSDVERRDREAKYGLIDGAALDATTWKYRLHDTSQANVESLVRDPLVEDTSGIDRTKFAIATADSLRLETQLDTVTNATAFLYYVFLSLPFVGAGVLLKLRKSPAGARVTVSTAHLVPLLVLAAMLNVAFMSRGSTNIRIPDVGVTSAILLAWLGAAFIGRNARVLVPHRIARMCVKAVAVVALGLTVLSVNGLAQVSSALHGTGFTRGPTTISKRAGEVWDGLGMHPSTFGEEGEQPGLLKIADYVRACTQRDDRLFVLGVYPELYYFADRRFAGGHAWLLPFYYSDANDESRIVARLKQAAVPIVLTEDRSEYAEEYRDVFEQVDAYLRAEYADVGEVDVGGSSLTVLVRSGLTPSGQYEPLGLPCFVSSDQTGDNPVR
jgi:hypothetical protein